MNPYNLLYRLRWLHAPAAILMLLLQRTPVLRMLTAGSAANPGLQSGELLKSAFALAALGACNSVAGATTFNATVASPTTVTPASGPVNTKFTASGAVGAAFSSSFSVSGAPSTVKSWKVIGTLPAGMSVTGGTAITGGYLYNGLKVTITGTPTAAATPTLTVTAYSSTGGTGDNGKITCLLNITGGVPSVAPNFTTQPLSQTVTAGTNVTFTSAASGTPTPTFQWYKGTTALTGQTGASLTLNAVQATNAGTYMVKAFNSAAPGGVSSNSATLVVPVAPAVVTVTKAWYVGQKVSLDLAGSGTYPAGTLFHASGLPAGLALDQSTGKISGQISGLSGAYTMTFWTQVGTASSTVNTLGLTVRAFPTILKGSFETLLDDTSSAAVAPFPVGKVELKVATGGVYTGFLTTTDATVYALGGSLTLNSAHTKAAATILITRAQVPAVPGYTLTISVDNLGAFTASLSTSAGAVGAGTGVKLAGVATAATYTLVMRNPVNLGTIADYPRGDGYFSATCSAAGTLTLKGKTGDGSTVSATAKLGVDGVFRLYAKPYGAAPGYLAGSLVLTPRADNAALSHITAAGGSDLYWSRPADALATIYPAGFGPLALEARMEPWDASTLTDFGARLGLTSTGNFAVNILGVYQSNSGPSANAALPVTLNLDALNTLTVVGTNSSKWTIKFTPATGVFSGTCYPTDRVTTHQATLAGVLLQPAPGDKFIGGGYLLAPAQNTSQTASTSSVEFAAP